MSDILRESGQPVDYLIEGGQPPGEGSLGLADVEAGALRAGHRQRPDRAGAEMAGRQGQTLGEPDDELALRDDIAGGHVEQPPGAPLDQIDDGRRQAAGIDGGTVIVVEQLDRHARAQAGDGPFDEGGAVRQPRNPVTLVRMARLRGQASASCSPAYLLNA